MFLKLNFFEGIFPSLGQTGLFIPAETCFVHKCTKKQYVYIKNSCMRAHTPSDVAFRTPLQYQAIVSASYENVLFR